MIISVDAKTIAEIQKQFKSKSSNIELTYEVIDTVESSVSQIVDSNLKRQKIWNKEFKRINDWKIYI